MLTSVFLILSLVTGLPLSSGFIVPGPTRQSSSLAACTEAELKAKFDFLKPALPTDINPVAAGGWNNIVKLSGHPKEELVSMIVDGLKEKKSKVQFAADEEKLEALANILYAKGKGFEADVVDGDWALVFSKQGRKSPRFQKVVGTREKAGRSMNTFNINDMTFTGDVTVLKKGKVASKVKYDTRSSNCSRTVDGKIVLRTIGCDIVGASFKFWKLPTLPLPLKRKGGHLEFVYMDNDIRITRGSRGGFFVHFRPEFLEQQLS